MSIVTIVRQLITMMNL